MSVAEDTLRMMIERERMSNEERIMRMAQQALSTPSPLPDWVTEDTLRMMWDGMTNTETPKSESPQKTLKLIKKSIKEIKEKPLDEGGEVAVKAKIKRLAESGLQKQAAILNAELELRVKLARVTEWNYKILPHETIEKYKVTGRGWDNNGGRFQVHIDTLANYSGNPEAGEAKDRIVPNHVLDELDKAKDRQVFDEYSVLWVEKVKDPLLLGCINGCEDYFLICEWGDDVTFDQIIKGKP